MVCQIGFDDGQFVIESATPTYMIFNKILYDLWHHEFKKEMSSEGGRVEKFHQMPPMCLYTVFVPLSYIFDPGYYHSQIHAPTVF